MRLEDLVARYLPEGGSVLDRRPEGLRGPLSLSAGTGIAVSQSDDDEAAEGPHVLVVLAAEAPGKVPAGVTVLLDPESNDERCVPEVLAWASDHGGQLMEVARLLTPPMTACAVLTGAGARIPTVPGSPGLVADDAGWRRLAGELVLERFRNTVLTERSARLTDETTETHADNARLRRRIRQLKKRLAAPAAGGDGGRRSRLTRLARGGSQD